MSPFDWIGSGLSGLDRGKTTWRQSLAQVVGAGSAIAIGILWPLALSFVLPTKTGFGASYLALAAPLALCAVGAVVLTRRRSPKGSAARNWAGGFVVGTVLLLLLYAGAG